MALTPVTLLVSTLLLFPWPHLARPASRKRHGFLFPQSYHGETKTEREYGLFIPHGYSKRKHYPLILFLHGAGEAGDDGRQPLEVGLGPVIRKQEDTFPFIAIFPQARQRSWQADAADTDHALAILKEVQQKYSVDPQRIYLTGLSMGGYGTWSLAQKYPERWAAIVPVCGGGNPKLADSIKDLPCWCFHGALDPIVKVAQSRQMIAALRAAGGNPRYTEYAEAGHDSWLPAYDTPGLFTWLLRHRIP